MADNIMLRKIILVALLALGFFGADLLTLAGDGGAALAAGHRFRSHHGRLAMFHHHHHWRHHARLGHGRWRFAARHHRAFRAEVTPSDQFASLPSSAPVASENRPLELHPLLAVAKRYIGRGNFTHHGGPWCRDAVNVWLRQAGYHLANNSRRAIDAVHLGHRVASPRPGDLVVMRHHVTIFAGWGGRGLVGLGGNQGHTVKYSHFSQRQVVAFVRP
jgi:hypothetical protein